MDSTKRPLTYQKILFSKFVGIPLAVVVGFVGGVVCAGQVWLKSGFELVQTEIVLTPPPPNARWCFPDMGFAGAEKFSKELRKQMTTAPVSQYSNTLLRRSMKAAKRNDEGKNGYNLHLLAVMPQHFAVIAVPLAATGPDGLTLVTEEGYYYLHPIPKRRYEKYDSLVSVRLGYRSQFFD